MVTYEEYHDRDWFHFGDIRTQKWWLHKRIENEVYNNKITRIHMNMNVETSRTRISSTEINKIEEIVRELK